MIGLLARCGRCDPSYHNIPNGGHLAGVLQGQWLSAYLVSLASDLGPASSVLGSSINGPGRAPISANFSLLCCIEGLHEDGNPHFR